METLLLILSIAGPILGGLIAIGSAIAPLTRTPVDDTIVAWLVRILQIFSAVQPRDVGGMKLPLTRPAAPAPVMRERDVSLDAVDPPKDSDRRLRRPDSDPAGKSGKAGRR